MEEEGRRRESGGGVVEGGVVEGGVVEGGGEEWRRGVEEEGKWREASQPSFGSWSTCEQI